MLGVAGRSLPERDKVKTCGSLALRALQGYEPYVIVARKYVPWYDERFVGYRKNKVVHLLHLAQMGMQFIVHPRAFTVHSPHPRARTWKVTHKTGLWDQVRMWAVGCSRELVVPASRPCGWLTGVFICAATQSYLHLCVC